MESNVLEPQVVESSDIAVMAVLDRPLHSYHLLQRLAMFDDDALVEPSTRIASAAEVCDFAYRNDVERNAAFEIETGKVTFDDAIRDGLFRRFLLYAQSYDVVGEGKPKEFADQICIGELHCPNIEGALAKWSTKSENSDAIGLELTVAGVGGGGWTSSAAFCATSEIETINDRCLGLYLNIRGEYVVWRNLDDRDRYMVMTNIFSIGNAVSTDVVRDPASDLCRHPEMFDLWNSDIARRHLVEGKDFEKFSVVYDGRAVKQGFTWRREREFNLSLGFEVKTGSISPGRVGFSVKSRFLREIRVEATCPPGHDYIGRYEGPTALPLRWSVSP